MLAETEKNTHKYAIMESHVSTVAQSGHFVFTNLNSRFIPQIKPPIILVIS